MSLIIWPPSLAFGANTPPAPNAMNEVTPGRQRAQFSVPFNDHARLSFGVAEPGHGVATIPADLVLTNHIGTVHGGALFTVSEAASGRALMSAVAAFAQEAGWQADELKMVVRTAQIRFLKLARGEIVARARVQTDPQAWRATLTDVGRVAIDVVVETCDSAGVRVAELAVEWHVSRRRDGHVAAM